MVARDSAISPEAALLVLVLGGVGYVVLSRVLQAVVAKLTRTASGDVRPTTLKVVKWLYLVLLALIVVQQILYRVQ